MRGAERESNAMLLSINVFGVYLLTGFPELLACLMLKQRGNCEAIFGQNIFEKTLAKVSPSSIVSSLFGKKRPG